MKYLGIFMGIFLLLGLNHLHADDAECEKLTVEATKLHWDYTNSENNVTLTMSYNITAKMEKACRLSKI